MTEVASSLMLDDSVVENALALAFETVDANNDTMGESASLPALPSTNGKNHFLSHSRFFDKIYIF